MSLWSVPELVHPMLFGISWMDPNWLLSHFGTQFFWISLLIIFVECGLFFPFLPGDTLLFAMGLFISTGQISVIPGGHTVNLIFALAVLGLGAFAGNVVGYEIGRRVGPPIYKRNGRILKQQYFDQTREFFEKHGNKALVIGRFVPFVRTYITLVAGASEMERGRFFRWSAIGAAIWVVAVTLMGYFLGQAFPGLGANIDKAIIVLLVVSVVPIAWEWWRRRRHSRRTPETQSETPNPTETATTPDR